MIERGYLGALALVGFVSVIPVSFAQWMDGSACPMLGPLPACHLVSLAYGVILIMVLLGSYWNRRIFWGAWLVLFSLAAVGSGFELAGHETCPKSETGMPKCFMSFALVCLLALPALIRFVNFKRMA